MHQRSALRGVAPSLRHPRSCPNLTPFPYVVFRLCSASFGGTATQAPAASPSGPTPFARAAKMHSPRSLQLNLGNNITVDLPNASPAPKQVRGRGSKRRHASTGGERRAPHAEKAETAVATTAITTSSVGFVCPRSGVAAASMLNCDTLLDALATPASVAPFSLPLPATKASAAEVSAAQARVAAAQANLAVLQTTALPVLFHFAAQQQQEEGSSNHLEAQESNGSAVAADRVADALHTLHTYLESIAAASRCDGRRHVSALPPPVVAALWDQVMPFLHHAALPSRSTDSRDGAASPPSAPAGPNLLKAPYLSVRHALALHTRAISPLLPPDTLAVVLTRLYQCGALSDDILSAVIATQVEKQRVHAAASPSAESTVGGTILILQQRVLRLGAGNAENDAPTAFRGATALTMARLLGKAAIPGHYQLHSFFHHALLPEVTRVLRSTAAAVFAAVKLRREGEAATDAAVDEHGVMAGTATAQPCTDALLDLTSAFRHYAVSGDAVQYLTMLWRAHFDLAVEPATWQDCAALLKALSVLPTASSRSRRRQARQVPRGGVGGPTAAHPEKLLQHMAEEDYYPLVEVVCAQMRRLSEAAVATGPLPSTSIGTDLALAAAPSQLLSLLRMLLRVNSPQWAETYDALATAVFFQVTAPLSTEASSHARLMDAFTVSEAQRTVMALLHRNTLIPDHPLHRLLLRRLLYATEAMTDSATAAAALLGLEVMIPVDEGSSDGESNQQQQQPQGANATQASDVVLLSSPPASDGLTVTPHDRQRALQLLRRHGRSMNPIAFVAGLCVAPVHRLPVPVQTSLVNHLTSVASAVPPVYLVKGIAAVVQHLNPAAVDDVSVQQWYTRFTARDVVRQVDAAGCAVLLDVLSANVRYEQNCALAKQAITQRIGVALRHAGEDVANTRGGGAAAAGGNRLAPYPALTLEQLPLVVSALRRGRVFLPPYFSRVCRMLLGQVETAALSDLLLPFSATAEEFMRRHQREGQASVFKDVWELLRGRLLEQVATLTLTDTCTALNAFAALDVCDRALFGVLVHHLWVCVQDAALEEAPTHEEGARNAMGRQSGSEEVEEARVRRLAHTGEQVTHILSPSAIGVVVTTLCAREDALQQQQQRGTEDNRSGDTMLPWMLLALRRHHSELYPIDVVHLLPTLLQRYATTAAAAPAAAPTPLLPLLHAAYDACRTTFLEMYAVLPDRTTLLPGAPEGSPSSAPDRRFVEGSTLTAEHVQRMADQRAAWSPAVQLSVRVVPRPWFVPLLLRLSSAQMVDVDVGLACVERVCTRRVCGTELPVDQLVDLCLSVCWMFQLSDLSAATASGVQETASELQHEDEASALARGAATPTTAGGATAVLRPAMAVVLSALWYRTDELSTVQIAALLRCLRDTYGADRVDADFVQRLERQKTLIHSRRTKTAADEGSNSEGKDVQPPAEATAAAAAASTPPPASAVDDVSAEDLFTLM